jgi:hypothetical protein
MTSRVKSGGLGRYFGFLTVRIPLPHNMVRAGVVKHPSEWVHDGIARSRSRSKRYGIIDLRELSTLCGFAHITTSARARRMGEPSGQDPLAGRDDRSSQALAVGCRSQRADRPRLDRKLRNANRRCRPPSGNLDFRGFEDPDNRLVQASHQRP